MPKHDDDDDDGRHLDDAHGDGGDVDVRTPPPHPTLFHPPKRGSLKPAKACQNPMVIKTRVSQNNVAVVVVVVAEIIGRAIAQIRNAPEFLKKSMIREAPVQFYLVWGFGLSRLTGSRV